MIIIKCTQENKICQYGISFVFAAVQNIFLTPKCKNKKVHKCTSIKLVTTLNKNRLAIYIKHKYLYIYTTLLKK